MTTIFCYYGFYCKEQSNTLRFHYYHWYYWSI